MNPEASGPDPGKLVLVVDDDLFMGRAISYMLREARGARTILASNADDGLRLACRMLPDLILLDVNMPGATAAEFCRLARKTPLLAEVPLHLLTGLLPGERRVVEVADLVQGIISKPPDPGELVALLDKAPVSSLRQHARSESGSTPRLPTLDPPADG